MYLLDLNKWQCLESVCYISKQKLRAPITLVTSISSCRSSVLWWGRGHRHATAYMWRSENSFAELISLLPSLGIQLRSLGFCSQQLDPLCLTSPVCVKHLCAATGVVHRRSSHYVGLSVLGFHLLHVVSWASFPKSCVFFLSFMKLTVYLKRCVSFIVKIKQRGFKSMSETHRLCS